MYVLHDINKRLNNLRCLKISSHEAITINLIIKKIQIISIITQKIVWLLYCRHIC